MASERLERMYRNPGSVQRRSLIAELGAHGWELARRARGHDIYAKPGWPEVIAVPARLKGTGTIRRIVRQIQTEESSRE